MVKKVTLVSVATVAALASASLWFSLQHMSHSVWYDEAQTNLIADQDTLGRIVEASRTVRPYPPLFFFAVHYSLLVRSNETGLRFPAAVFGALAILAVFLMGREWMDDLTGVIAALLFTLTPGVFRYFVDGNSYTLLMLASALSTLCLLRAARTNRTADWILYGLSALLGLGTHTLFVFHLGAQCVAGLYLLRSSPQLPAGRPYRRLGTAMALLVVPLALWYFDYFRSGGDVRPLVWSRAFEPRLLLAAAGMYLGPLSFGGISVLVLWCLLQVLGLVGLVRGRTRVFWTAAILAGLPIVAITPFVASTLGYVAYRYALGSFPLACVVAACSWRVLQGRNALGAACAAGLILAYCAAGAHFILRTGSRTFEYQDWKSAGDYLTRSALPDRTVVLTTTPGFLPLTYYYKARGVLMAPPNQIGDQVVDVLRRDSAPDTAVWVALSTFANENPQVASFTEFPGNDLSWTAQDLVSALVRQGFSACHISEFHRVTVFSVRRQACPSTGPPSAR